MLLLAVAVPTASAATAPTTSISAASSVTSSSATLNGSINPNGSATSWYFEYGTSTKYNSRTATQNAGSGTGTVNVSASVSGLAGSRTYHYRLVATSEGGTSYSSDLTFSTGNAPAVATANASSVEGTSARLNGTVNPNGQATTWYFEYGPTTAYGSKTAVRNAGSGTRSVNVSTNVSSLAAGTAYHFRLVATNGSGTVFGADQSFTTSAPPAVQTNPAANLTPTTVTLTGTVDPKGRTTTWWFDYGANAPAYGSRTAGQNIGAGNGPQAVSATISNLSPGATYHYRLVASNSIGTVAAADVAFTLPPAVTLNTSAFKVTAGSFVTLTGTVSGGQTGIKVTVLGQPFGESSPSTVGEVFTGAGGAWTYLARPLIQTAYQASVNGSTSTGITVGVRPSLSLRLITGHRFSSHVSAASSFAGKLVQLQRLANGHWVTVKRLRLGSKSTTIFQASLLPPGKSSIRVALSVNQAGPGYLAGFSRTVTYRR